MQLVLAVFGWVFSTVKYVIMNMIALWQAKREGASEQAAADQAATNTETLEAVNDRSSIQAQDRAQSNAQLDAWLIKLRKFHDGKPPD